MRRLEVSNLRELALAVAAVAGVGGNVYQAQAPVDCAQELHTCEMRCDTQLEGQAVRDSDECWRVIDRVCGTNTEVTQ